MIEDLTIISRSNNKISYPNIEWNSLNKIYVNGILNLGLSDKIHFTQDNCPTLTEVINLINGIKKNSQSEFELKSKEGKIRIENAKLVRVYKYTMKGESYLVLEKKHYMRPSIDKMTKSIWKQIAPLNRELRNQIAILLNGNPKFNHNTDGIRLGDKVITSSHVESKREGIVSFIGYHKINEAMKEYTSIVIEGEQHNRRYESNELLSNE